MIIKLLMYLISVLASFPVAVIAAFYFIGNTMMFYTILAALAITVVVITFLRLIFRTERPSVEGINKHFFRNRLHGRRLRMMRHHFEELNKRSFASGHVARVVIFGASFYFFNYPYSWVAAAGIFAMIMAFSRLYLKRHRTIDIITGFIIGAASAYAGFYVVSTIIF